MASFTVVVGDADTGASYQLEAEAQNANRFIGKSIGDEVDGSAVGLDGYTLEITGGSDNAGRPLSPNIAGGNLKSVLLKERTTGYKPGRDGERRRITLRGREISGEVSQVNARVAEAGSTSIGDLLADAEDGDSDE